MDRTAFEAQFTATTAAARDLLIKQAAMPTFIKNVIGTEAKQLRGTAKKAWGEVDELYKGINRLDVSDVERRALSHLEDVARRHEIPALKAELNTRGARGILAGAGLGAAGVGAGIYAAKKQKK